MEIVPFALAPVSTVLVAGAGGGFDFLCGLPIALELEATGHRVHIASYSFTDLKAVEGATWHSPALLEVTAGARLTRGDYFPERLLCGWYRERRDAERSVWCFPQVGVVPLRGAYDTLVDRLGVDTVICIDGDDAGSPPRTRPYLLSRNSTLRLPSPRSRGGPKRNVPLRVA